MKILIFILIVFINFCFAQNFNAEEILTKVDNTTACSKNQTAKVEMQMINLNNKQTKIKKADFYKKGLNYKLFKYTYPESDKGIATLTTPEGVYLYLPMFKKPKKVTNLAANNSLNKSDFSLEDMNNKPLSVLFEPHLIKDSADVYILKLIPKEQSTYKYIVSYINKKLFTIKTNKYFDKKNVLIKQAEYSYIKINNCLVVKEISMTNLKRNHQTRFIMNNIKINTAIDNSVFEVSNLGKK